jgi:hypothetical protein
MLDRVEGYGERSSPARGRRRGSGEAGGSDGVGGDVDNDDIGGAPTRAWRDRPVLWWGEVNGTVTCANCCLTLGYVSDRDPVRGEPSVGVEPKGSTLSLYCNPPVQYSPLLLESFLRLRLFSPDECMAKGSFGIALEKQRKRQQCWGCAINSESNNFYF